MQVEIKDKGFYPIPYCDKYLVYKLYTTSTSVGQRLLVDIEADTKYYRCIYGGTFHSITYNSKSKITSNSNHNIKFNINKKIDYEEYFETHNNYSIEYDDITGFTNIIFNNIKDNPIYVKKEIIVPNNEVLNINGKCDIIVLPYIDLSDYVKNSVIKVKIEPQAYIKNKIDIVNDIENIIYKKEIRKGGNYTIISNKSNVTNGRTNFIFETIGTDASVTAGAYSYIQWNSEEGVSNCYLSGIISKDLTKTKPFGYSYVYYYNNNTDTNYEIFDGKESLLRVNTIFTKTNSGVTRLGFSYLYRYYQGSYVELNDIVLTNNNSYNMSYRNEPTPETDLEKTIIEYNAINITLYNNSSENHRVDKTNYLEELVTLSGVFREEISVINPVFRIETDIPPTCNYCYINIFNRYYYVDNIVMVRNNLWELYCTCDTLMSFKVHIYELNAYIGRQETKYSPYIVDSKLPALLEPTITYNNSDSLFVTNGYNVVMQTINSESSGTELTPYGISSSIYAFNKDNLKPFIEKLFTGSGIGINNFYQSPNEAIISCVYYPFSIINKFNDEDDYDISETVFVGNTGILISSVDEKGTIENPVCKLNKYVTRFSFELGIIQPIYDNYLDFNGYTMANLYVPFFGFIDIDINLVLNKYLRITYVLDVVSGQATFEIIAYDNPTSKLNMLYTGECMVGVQFALSSNNSVEINRNNLLATVNLVGNAVTLATGFASNNASLNLGLERSTAMVSKNANLASAMSNKSYSDAIGNDAILTTNFVSSTITDFVKANTTHYAKGRTSVGYNKYYLTQSNNFSNDGTTVIDVIKAFLIRTTVRPSIDLNDYNYKHNIGRPYQGFEKLNDLKGMGYTEVIGIHLDGVPTATQEEKSNIELQLRNGVLL